MYRSLGVPTVDICQISRILIEASFIFKGTFFALLMRLLILTEKRYLLCSFDGNVSKPQKRYLFLAFEEIASNRKKRYLIRALKFCLVK